MLININIQSTDNALLWSQAGGSRVVKILNMLFSPYGFSAVVKNKCKFFMESERTMHPDYENRSENQGRMQSALTLFIIKIKKV